MADTTFNNRPIFEDIKVLEIKTYLSDGNIPKQEIVADTTTFLKKDITHLGIQLNLEPSSKPRRVALEWYICRKNGHNFSNFSDKIKGEIMLNSGENILYHSWGFSRKESWPAGEYYVMVTVNGGAPVKKDFEVKKSLMDKTPCSNALTKKYLLLALATVLFPPALLIYIFRDLIKAWFWDAAMSSGGSSTTSYTNTSNSLNADNSFSDDKTSSQYVFGDGKGNFVESGCVFYDFRGNLCEWGSPFYDGKGNLCEWGSSFYDGKGNLCEWGSPFYDARGNLIDPR